ncbi:MAG: carbohydrate-binding domain-containing protein [Rhodopila sp.]
MAEPSAYEQYLLELVNAARANPTATASSLGIGLNDGLPAGTISGAPEAPLAFNPALISAAQQHGAWMLANNTFSHTGANGNSPGDRMTAAGYIFTGSWTWGENIAITYGGGTAVSAATVVSLENGLFKSPDHRVNLLNPAFKEVGLGVVGGTYQGSAAVDATQDFAKSGSSSFLTGVAYNDLSGDNFYEPGEGLGGVSVLVKSGSGQTWQTTTWASGGYQMALGAGTYSVTFSGGGLTAPVTKSVSIGSANVEVDLNTRVDKSTVPTPPPTGATVLGTGQNTLALSVSEDAWKGDAQFTVSVDGKQIGGIQTATASHAAGGSQEFDVKGTFGAGQHKATVTFLNDAWGGAPATDRNLYVTAAKIDGTTVPAATLIEHAGGPQSFTFLVGATTSPSLTMATASGAASDAVPQAAATDAQPPAGGLGHLPAESAAPSVLWDRHDAAVGQAMPAHERAWHGGLGFLPDHPLPAVSTPPSTHPFG